MPRSSGALLQQPNKQLIKQASQILETERVWDHLRNRYYNEWLDGDTSIWPAIHLKLQMINDLRELLRKFDNARDTGAKSG